MFKNKDKDVRKKGIRICTGKERGRNNKFAILSIFAPDQARRESLRNIKRIQHNKI